MKKSIIVIDYPHQLIPAITALKVYRRHHNVRLDLPIALYIKAQYAAKMSNDEFNLIQSMLTEFAISDCVCLSKTVCHPNIPVAWRASLLKQQDIDALFYAHDVSADFTVQTVMQAYPDAKRICFGDSLGIVYSHQYFEQLMYQGRSISKWKRQWILPRKKNRLTADVAILPIPCDPGADVLPHCPLLQPTADDVTQVIQAMLQHLPTFVAYQQQLIEQAKHPIFCLAISNLAESKLTSREQELALYQTIVDQQIKTTATIIIKPHPGSSDQTVSRLQHQLSQRHQVMVFAKQFNFLPIELASILIDAATVLSISYSSVSLPFLYQSAVKHVLTDQLIDQFIAVKKRYWLRASNQLYRQLIANLQQQKKIAVIIVNYFSLDYLQQAVQAVLAQHYPAQRIIIVNNSPEQAITEAITSLSTSITVINAPGNVGFAKANNMAAAAAQDCDWLALLNPDAIPDPHWLQAMVQAIDHYSDFSGFASRLVQADNHQRLDGTGDVYHVSGRPWRRDYNQAVEQHRLQTSEVFAPCAAAAIYRRDAFLAVDGFDEDYFCYLEDIDLAFRMRLLGYRFAYVPDALVYHHGSAVTKRHSDFYLYHGHRNICWTYLKNMPGSLFWLYLPWHVLLNVFTIAYFTLKGRCKVIVRAKWHALKGLPNILKKRKHWQAKRVVSSWSLRKLMATGFPWPKRQRGVDEC